MYGKELIIDIHNCDVSKFDRVSLEKFFIKLCELIDMKRGDLHFWDYEDDKEEYNKAPDHLKGISAIQFITTSNITIHTLDVLKVVYLNIFSCKDFDYVTARDFCKEYFAGIVVNYKVVKRL